MAEVNLGRIGFVNKGSWSDIADYKINDVVKYSGSTYAAKRPNTGVTPPTNGEDTDDWFYFVNNSDYVDKTSEQDIVGVKNFTESPLVPTPTTNTQAANKAYADTKQANLGFTPVQQGTGIGQSHNVVKIGWSNNRTKITIDATDMGNIVMDSNIGIANSPLVKTALNASGTAPIYACRAWVNFNGTGTVAIRASGNVSSIIDNGVGEYTVNFTTAMVDANYAVAGTVQTYDNTSRTVCGTSYNTASIQVRTVSVPATPEDMITVSIAILR